MEREKIFVVLGTQKFQLNRLLIELDRLKEENKELQMKIVELETEMKNKKK